MTKKNEFSLFHITFIGELVQIITNIYQKHVEGNEEGISDSTVPLVMEGFILDMDDEFYYLGDTPDEITNALKKEDLKAIRIVTERSLEDEILEEMPIPDNGGN